MLFVDLLIIEQIFRTLKVNKITLPRGTLSKTGALTIQHINYCDSFAVLLTFT